MYGDSDAWRRNPTCGGIYLFRIELVGAKLAILTLRLFNPSRRWFFPVFYRNHVEHIFLCSPSQGLFSCLSLFAKRSMIIFLESYVPCRLQLAHIWIGFRHVSYTGCRGTCITSTRHGASIVVNSVGVTERYVSVALTKSLNSQAMQGQAFSFLPTLVCTMRCKVFYDNSICYVQLLKSRVQWRPWFVKKRFFEITCMWIAKPIREKNLRGLKQNSSQNAQRSTNLQWKGPY